MRDQNLFNDFWVSVNKAHFNHTDGYCTSFQITKANFPRWWKFFDIQNTIDETTSVNKA